MKIADQPAFPLSGDKHQSEIGKGVLSHDYKGLTKREMFAAMAMQGLLSGDYPDKNIHNNIQLPEIKLVAEQSVAYADELLKQLES